MVFIATEPLKIGKNPLLTNIIGGVYGECRSCGGGAPTVDYPERRISAIKNFLKPYTKC